MIHRNIHLRAATPPPAAPAPEAEATLHRVRRQTNSPAQEFASRQGDVVPLPDSIHALILHRQAWVTVQKSGLRLDVDGQALTFWHENSLVCATRVGERVLVTHNRHQLDVVHVLSEDGEFIESIQRKGEAQWFDAESTARELARHKAAQSRVIARVAALHATDAQEALARAAANTGQMQKAVHNFPLPAAPTGEAPAMPRASRLANAVATTDQRRASTAAAREREAARLDAEEGDIGDLAPEPAPRREPASYACDFEELQAL